MKTFNQEDLLDFQEISQDQNPIHHQGVVFGMQLLAYLEGELEKQLHFQQLLDINYCFYQPLYIGEGFELKVEEYHFQVFVKGKLIGEGEVHGK